MGKNSVIIVGLEKVGKSSILRRFRSDEFNAKEKPTLGTQISKIIISNTNFLFYDLGGQGPLRKNWFNKIYSPKSIIYVVDCNSSKEKQIETQKEFKKILDFYFSDKKTPPLLILANKIDMAVDLSPYYLKNMFFMLPHKLNYHLGYCSAKSGKGITENFQWLIGEMVKYGI